MSLLAYVAISALVALSLGLALAALILKRARDSSGSWTPEHIAYLLLTSIARAEGKSLLKAAAGEPPDRKWLLDTFAECMEAVRDPDKRLAQSKL